jgi:dodecin
MICNACSGRSVPALVSGNQRSRALTNHVYRITELAGSSEKSHADAIEKAIERASKTLKHLAWFEVKEQRGEIESGTIKHYQVILKVGFRIED